MKTLISLHPEYSAFSARMKLAESLEYGDHVGQEPWEALLHLIKKDFPQMNAFIMSEVGKGNNEAAALLEKLNGSDSFFI